MGSRPDVIDHDCVLPAFVEARGRVEGEVVIGSTPLAEINRMAGGHFKYMQAALQFGIIGRDGPLRAASEAFCPFGSDLAALRRQMHRPRSKRPPERGAPG